MATYDPKKIILTFGGSIIGGYADGTGISVDSLTDDWSLSTGMDDFSAYTKLNNSTGEIVITLSQSSLSNVILSGFRTIDQTANAGLLPLLLKDVGGTTEVSGIGRIKKAPTLDFANDISPREWTLLCSNLNITVGGNL